MRPARIIRPALAIRPARGMRHCLETVVATITFYVVVGLSSRLSGSHRGPGGLVMLGMGPVCALCWGWGRRQPDRSPAITDHVAVGCPLALGWRTLAKCRPLPSRLRQGFTG